jgi:hypothetical protein
MMFPSIYLAPYFSRSQARTYAIPTTKNTIVHITKIKSGIVACSSFREGSCTLRDKAQNL